MSNYRRNECPLCLENMRDAADAMHGVKCPAQHALHRACYMRVRREEGKRMRCPTCRRNATSLRYVKSAKERRELHRRKNEDLLTRFRTAADENTRRALANEIVASRDEQELNRAGQYTRCIHRNVVNSTTAARAKRERLSKNAYEKYLMGRAAMVYNLASSHPMERTRLSQYGFGSARGVETGGSSSRRARQRAEKNTSARAFRAS